MQPTLVQTSEVWNEKGDVVAASDYLWRELNRMYAVSSTKILDEGISAAYVDLYRVSQTLPVSYKITLAELNKAAHDAQLQVLTDTQRSVLSFAAHKDERVTAAMGNSLRSQVAHDRRLFEQRIQKILAPLLSEISMAIAKSDRDLLASLRLD